MNMVNMDQISFEKIGVYKCLKRVDGFKSELTSNTKL